jgi:hypothetical protein
LPSSLARVSPQTPWAAHPGAPVSVLGTGAGDPSRPPFHGPQGSAEPAYAGHSPLRPLLAITALQGLRVVSRVAPVRGPPVRLPRGVGGRALRCREAYPRGTGILTCFPFPGTELRPRLGPANPRLTTIAGEPWPFPAAGILTPLRCYYRRDPHSGRLHRTSRPGFCAIPTPAYRTHPHWGWGPGSRRPV